LWLEAEITSAMNLLLSEKEPIIKKRQLMRTIFGDYRKMMKIHKWIN